MLGRSEEFALSANFRQRELVIIPDIGVGSLVFLVIELDSGIVRRAPG
jgi:hypothetical protein